jgi:hypothetical protein
MSRRALALTAAALAALALTGCDRQREAAPPPPADVRPIAKAPAVAAGEEDPYAGVTEMAQRVAVLGLLNKRNGLVRDITLKPGESIRIGRAVVRLRACERTAQWESPQETGAFVQLIVLDHGSDQWRRVFSGWLFKDRPERNIVQHGIYDVFVKSCTMSWPGEVAVPSGDEAPAAASNRSSAPQSPSAPAAAAPAADAAPAPAPAPAPEPADSEDSAEDTAG